MASYAGTCSELQQRKAKRRTSTEVAHRRQNLKTDLQVKWFLKLNTTCWKYTETYAKV
jgi:hypothetical protein